MLEVVFISHDEQEYRVNTEVGRSVMQAAVDNDVPGILAECGGCAACATCRVFVEPEWISRLPAPELLELSVLDIEGATAPGLRLSCQVQVDASMAGLTVRLPESQF